MKQKLLAIVVLFIAFCLPQLSAQNAAESAAFKTVSAEIAAALEGKSAFVNSLGHVSTFRSELNKVLRQNGEPGTPKPLMFNGKPAKILVPLNLSDKKVGGFFQVSPDGKRIISYLVWDKNLKPLFVVDRDKWEKAADAAALPELAELIPISDGHSAGVPVDPADLTDMFIIDYINILPSKTQEERKAHTDAVGLKAHLGRRTGSSKCLSYAASLASDWWHIAQGNKIGSYDSFVNGAREFGTNPRMIESLYFSFPKCPYSFVKETGLDRVTGEKIPYSPKHYAWIMSSVNLPEKINDPLKSDISYSLPKRYFGMDLPFMNSFDRSRGNIEQIKEDLQRYGIMYAQHTSRLFSDKVSLILQGVHAVNIVGTAKLKGEPVVLYYETFGKNHRDYLEDSFYGPALRAFPVKFFYQGIVFPHRIIADVTLSRGQAEIAFKTAAGKAIAPEKVAVKVNGKTVKTKASPKLNLAIPEECVLTVEYSRRYFHTPEESEGYVRNYLISNGQMLEISQYEAILKTLAERNGGLFKKILGKDDSYTDHLIKLAEQTCSNLKAQAASLARNQGLMKMIAAELQKSKVLARSDFGKAIAEITRFNELER